jgi:hypothetical protein
MATHWLREITTTTTGASTGFPFGSKVLALYLRYVLGFTNNSEFVDSVGVGDSVTAPDPTPGPDLNKQTLTDTDGRFVGSVVATDVGKQITITNMVDPNNNGVFTITDYIGPTQIKYVNAAGSAETSSFDWQIQVLDESAWSTEKSGSNGSINITGSDKTFQDSTAASFTAGDTGKWLLLVDSTNPENSGFYKATFVDASNVTLDFRSGATEYPTQNLGANLSWWLLGDDYQIPQRRDAWWRLQTPHANGWQIEVKWSDAGTDQGFQIRVAADGNLGGSKVLPTVYIGVDDSDTTWFYCAGDDAGEFINFFFHNATSAQYGGFIVSNLILSEPGRSSDEQVALMGNTESLAGTWSNLSTYQRSYADSRNVTYGSVWNDIVDTYRTIIMMEPSYYNSTQGLASWTGRTVNSRTGNWDFLEGQLVITDPDNLEAIGEYEIVGSLQGFYLTSTQATDRTAYDDDATKDRFHVLDGHAVEWPGYTQQH